MKHLIVSALMGSAALLATPSIGHASKCEDVPDGDKGQASVTKKYIKIKAEAAHADRDCHVKRSRGSLGGNNITVVCRVHFRPRNGGCFASYSPNGEQMNLSHHPGCSSKWAWIQGVAMVTPGSAETPQGDEFTGSVRFDMIRDHYEAKYTVEVGDKYDQSPAYTYYRARLKKICLRSY